MSFRHDGALESSGLIQSRSKATSPSGGASGSFTEVNKAEETYSNEDGSTAEKVEGDSTNKIDAFTGAKPSDDPEFWFSKVCDVYRSSIALILGNILEWYEWTLFGYMEILLTHLFFGSVSGFWLIFAVPFLARPFGSTLFGCISDFKGRKVALVASVALMGLSTCLQGLLMPGVPGMIFLQTLLRFGSGISAGGESASVVVYLSEFGEREEKGLLFAATFGVAPVTSAIASILAIGSVYLLHLLPPESQTTWGWRCPFLLAGPLTAASLYMRTEMAESPIWAELQASRRMRRSGGDEVEVAGATPSEQPTQTYGALESGLEETDDATSGFWASVPASEIAALLLTIVATLPNQLAFYFPMILASWLRYHLHVTTELSMMVALVSKLVQLAVMLPAAFIADEKGVLLCTMAGTFGLAASLIPALKATLSVRDSHPVGGLLPTAIVLIWGGVIPMLTSPMMSSDLLMTSMFPGTRRTRMVGLGLGLRSVITGFSPLLWEVLSDRDLWLPWISLTGILLLCLASQLAIKIAVNQGWLVVYQREWLL